MKATLMLVGTIIAVCGLTTATSKTVSDVSDMERSARALELYLQDQKDHEKHCPSKKWDQPALDIYKKTLRSHLPEGCIK